MNGIAPFDGAFRAKHGLALLLVIVEFGFLLWCVLRSEITVKAKVLILSGCALAIAVPSSMGFSPTVWASSDRVFLPGDFMLIGFGILIYHHAKSLGMTCGKSSTFAFCSVGLGWLDCR